MRITRLDAIDVGLFEHDRNNAIYFYALNADEQIYWRYGGRDSASAETYLHTDSLVQALQKGLDLHRRYLAGDLPKTARAKPIFPREIPLLVKRTFDNNQCVECHLVQDYQNMHKELDGTLDPVRDLYKSPDIKTLGIYLDIPQGLLVREAKGAAIAAGMQAGDRIAAVNGTPVYTFGDLQYQYDKVDRKADRLELTVERAGKPAKLTIDLPTRWWWTDLRFRQSSVDPRLYFEDKPLAPEDKQLLGLKASGFASEVKYVSDFAKVMQAHELKVGDVIVSVDGVESDPLAHTAELYLKLRKPVGSEVTLLVLRGGEKMKMPLKSSRMSFRK
ncbi:MAG: PDZ domain-containing protein [Bryobacteraceae bacterium]|nr:PDZ domain-containing protein [Bryobacteraceae bacterium]